MVFMPDLYYPDGGMKDFSGDFDTLEEAMMKIAKEHCECWHIYSIKDRCIVDSDVRVY